MLKQTIILFMRGSDDPVNVYECYDLLPNIFVGMQIQIQNTKYRVNNICITVEGDICRQIILVEEICDKTITGEELAELMKELENYGKETKATTSVGDRCEECEL